MKRRPGPTTFHEPPPDADAKILADERRAESDRKFLERHKQNQKKRQAQVLSRSQHQSDIFKKLMNDGLFDKYKIEAEIAAINLLQPTLFSLREHIPTKEEILAKLLPRMIYESRVDYELYKSGCEYYKEEMKEIDRSLQR